MNIYTILLTVFLIIPFLVNLAVEKLNLSAITTKIPREFKGVYKEDAYKKSQEYLKISTKFHLLETGLTTLAALIFLIVGGFNLLDRLVLSLGSSQIIQGLAFVEILLILNIIIGLPFSIYDTFIIEQKFGFNKTTPQTFIKDVFVSFVLSSILVGVIFSVLIFLFSNLGTGAWLLAWVFVSLFQLFILLIAPVVIMPLFNKFTSLKNGKLKIAIEKYARNQNFKIQGIYTMDGSKRSTKSNAFFTGIGRFRRIVLFDTLIKQHSVNELVAVLAHEIGHYKKKHILKQILLSILTTGILFFVLSLLIDNPVLFQAFNVKQISVYGSLVFIFVLISPIFEFVNILTNKISREFEFEADEYAVKTSGHKKDFVNALKKLSVNNLSNLTPHPWKVIMDYSHPPILQRIERVKKM